MAYSYDDYGWYDDEPEYGSVWGDDESRYFGGDEYDAICRYCGFDCDGDCDPVRCEADIRDGVCQWRIPIGGICPNVSNHIHADGIHYDDGIPF